MTTDNFCFHLQNRLIKPVKQEVNSTMILPPLVFPGWYAECHSDKRRGAGTSSQALSFAGGYRGTITTTADSSPPKFRLKIVVEIAVQRKLSTETTSSD
jgi:hypothetical protein